MCQDPVYRAMKDLEYLKKTGEYDRRKREDEENRRIANDRMREAMGSDYSEKGYGA